MGLLLLVVILASMGWPTMQQLIVRTINDLPDDVYKIQLAGIVTSVHSGDSFMFYHTPSGEEAPKRINYRDTLIIRLVGIEAPRMPRPGTPGEPFAFESRDRLTSLILNQRIMLELYSKDAKNELRGSVLIKGQYLSLKLVDEGLASVLKVSNAEYGPIKAALFRGENIAKRRKVGIWAVDGNDS